MKRGFDKALFLAETEIDSDYFRWLGFKQAMESKGGFCPKSRYIVLPSVYELRIRMYEQVMDRFREAGALAFSSDYDAIEAMNYFYYHNIHIPNDISVTGFDDNMYSSMIHPKLTTIHQNVSRKAYVSMEQLLKMIQNEPLVQHHIKLPVELVIRDTVGYRL